MAGRVDAECVRARVAGAGNRARDCARLVGIERAGAGQSRRRPGSRRRAARRRSVDRVQCGGVGVERSRQKYVRSRERAQSRHSREHDVSTPVVVPDECALPGSPLAKERAGIDACVHCGFCLQACPTYLTLEDENDSPRGRILLMRSLLDGTLEPENDSVQTHIAQCLGCRACETACPSGVPYGHLLEATRATLAEYRPIPFIARAILSVFSHPVLM